MKAPPRLFPCCLALAVALFARPPGGLAQPAFPYDGHVPVPTRSFAVLGLPSATGGVADLASDATGRLWVATPQGVSALVPAVGADPAQPDTLLERAPFFPFDSQDGLLEDAVSAVAFAEVGGEEHFFLGFPSGLQYGRVISTSGLSLPSDTRLSEGAPPVRALASTGATSVWAATGAGVERWDLSGSVPTLNDTQDVFSEDEPAGAVAVFPADPTSAAYTTPGAELWVATRGAAPVAVSVPSGVEEVLDLAFDLQGDLWVLGEGAAPTNVKVWKYGAAALASPGTAAPAAVFDFGELTGSDRARALAVDDTQGAVWIATSQGAYFQAWDAGRELGGSWERLATESDDVRAVYVDPAGNVWLGTDQGVEALLLRLLSVDSSKYIGFGAQARVTVIDVASQGAGSVEVEINGVAEPVAETSAPGVFEAAFGFSEAAGAGVIQVSSTAADTPLEFVYDFGTGSIAVRASWSNEQPFEDDLWIGNLCFIGALDR
ncbi:MAG: hypothetical protein Kow0092_12830 [Deferrisomatales bacterium]